MASNNDNIFLRLWQYQKERFPLIAHGILILAFVLAGMFISRILRGDISFPDFNIMAMCFVCVLFIFLQLRIADEFKDFEDDKNFRPYRPVPRGLISLKELFVLGIITCAAQLYITYSLNINLTYLLIAVWVYLGLMSVEFFAVDWLKARPFTYMWSHMIIIMLINLFISAFDWVLQGNSMPEGLIFFLLMSFGGGFTFEIGRKIRSPEIEEKGVETYSVVWGMKKATYAWFGALSLLFGGGIITSFYTGYTVLAAIVTIVMMALNISTGLKFIAKPTPALSKKIDTFSGLSVLMGYLAIGIVPLIHKVYFQ
ncbi:MAG: UbiA family prenyltransferase [Alphaproteobacteria bacterium]|nr:UbiA family prenyltransferase [Alphaproteobacteria bacterium]OJV11940.1 MAG: hypothetical protein BGO27_00550 [Alphaproteobacteria bacterium 33-17]